jgi:membrane associated rhomboid family serine protease
MIPLRDVIPSRTTPLVTVGLILANAAVFVYELTLGERELSRFVDAYGLVPASASPLTALTSMFIHGGLLHFGGNMLYLWIFGDNVEDRMGHDRFLVFYLACGATASALQMLASPQSRVPMVGASGAIAGVLGAYLVMFPRSRVLTFVPLAFFFRIVEVPALVLLGLWFVLQLLLGLSALSATAADDLGGVAFWAHAGGFVAGMALVPLFKRRERDRVEWWGA